MAANNFWHTEQLKQPEIMVWVPDDYTSFVSTLDNTDLFSVKLPSMVQPAEKMVKLLLKLF